MKKNILFISAALLLLSLNLTAQDWVSMMRNPKANVHDVQNAFYKWYNKSHKTDKDKRKAVSKKEAETEDESYELFKRWEWYNVPRADINGNRADLNKVGADYENYLKSCLTHTPPSSGHSMHRVTPSSGAWFYAGNTTVPTNSSSGNGGSGRVNRVRMFPGNNNIMFACAASGGLWKSTNGGTTWATATDQLGDLTTSDVVINPMKTNVMYLATGDGDGLQSIYPTPATIGVLKSSDGGATWVATGLTYTLTFAGNNNYSVNELIMDPADTSVLIAATSFGVYRTTNSGATWTQTQTGWFHSVEFEPSHPAIVYAAASNLFAGGAKFYRSVDNGVTWTNITSGLPTSAAAEGFDIGVTAADTTVVYVLADNVSTYDYNGLYRSTNHGVSFTKQSGSPTLPNVLGRAQSGNDYGVGQGWYDLTMAVSQTNRDSVFVGGINIWSSSNGGVNWTLNADWTGSGAPFVHADMHDIQFIPGTNSKGYVVGCDGGIFITLNSGTNWSNISNNIEIAQQYSVGPSATVAGKWLTGWQDNGTNLSSSPWAQVLGGDGMVCFIDYSVPAQTTFYGENPQGQLSKSTNSGASWSGITTGITESGPWVTQWLQDPKTPATLYSGFQNVWKSTNGGGSWSKISPWGTSSITALAVDSSNTNFIYAAQSNLIEITTNGGASWSNITGTLPVGSASISAIAVSSKLPSHIWVTFSGYSAGNQVFASVNSGATWTNISAGLPTLPVNCIVSESGSPNGIYVGTDQGVYYHDTVTNAWTFFNTGLPMVMIGDLKIYQAGHQLIAGTYGRGTWESPLFVSGPCVPPTVVVTNTPVLCNGGSTGSATATPSGGTLPYTYAWTPSGGTNATAPGLSAATYTVTVTDANGCTVTGSTTITQPPVLTASIGSVSNVKCTFTATGSATVTAGGGTPGYAYTWTPAGGTGATASFLSAGTYTVNVVDNNGCNVSASVTITQPTITTANITTIVNVKCNGGSTGSLTVTAGGGTPAYTYAWTPSGGSAATASNLSAGTYTVTVTDANGCTATASATITEPSVLTTTTSTTPATCASNNGSATATPAGGTTPYTYTWAPGGATSATASNLSVGTYTVTVKDANGCSVTASAVVASGGGLTASISGTTNVKCNGGATGSATATQVGGTAPYIYSWAPGGNTNATATGLTAGTYTVTVTDKNGCTGTASATITQPVALTTTTTTAFATCNGSNGSATANPAGGTVPYTYSWAPGGNTNQTATGLSGGTYTVTVTDANGCTATAFAVVGNTGGVAVAISAQTDENCNGDAIGSATSNPSGGTLPYTYNWTPSGGTNQLASGLIAGTYTITVTDALGCTGTASATITQPAVLTTTTSVTPETCSSSNGTATATPAGGTSPYTYSWAPGGQTTAAITGLTAGTYTVNVTDAHGCTVTATATVVSAGGLTVTITNTGVLCNGGGTGTATATGSAGTAPYTYFWTPSGGTNATASNLTAGTYTCHVTDALGCTGSASTVITQPVVLTVTTGTIVNVKCNGGATGSATATPAGGTVAYTYDWSPGGNTNATATGLSVGTYTVTVTDKNGCMATATAVITQPALLTVSTSGIVDVTCNGGATGSATATAGGGSPAYTYNWAPGGNTNATATGLTAGTYTITVTDANACTATATAIITQPVALTVTTGGIVNVKCNGGATGAATATPAGGTVPYTYNWTPSGGTGATASGLTAGTYTITVTDANGCTATATAIITQPPVLTVTVVNTPVKCNGASTGTATATAGGGTPAYTYNWTPSGGSGFTATGLSAGTYTITLTDVNGCTATSSTIITQPAALTVGVIGTGVKCNGGATGTATATPAGGTVPYTYAWTPSGGTNATASGLTVGTYTVTVTDKNACTVTAAITITQPTALTVITNNTPVKCNGGATATATATPGGGTPAYTYSWAPGGGSGATISNLTAGCYTVTITDANGCTATAITCITQPTVLTVSTTTTSASCGNSNGSATAIPAGGTPAYTYSWSFGPTTATVTGLSAGCYTVTVVDANGCNATATACVTTPPVLTVSVVNTPVKCNGGATGTATATPGGGTPGYTYNWTPSGGTNATASNLTAGTYTITVKDVNGCTATASTTITQPPLLTVITSGIVNEKCNGASTGSINATAGGGTPAYTYSWAPSGGSGVTASNLSAGTYTITVKDANGCTATATGTVTQPAALTAVVTNTPVKCNGGATGTATVTAGGGTLPYVYAWTPGGQTSTTASALTAGCYTVTVTDKNGCTVTASSCITQPPVLTAVITAASPVTCNGGNNGSATVTAGGGTVAYTYNWAPSGGTNNTTTALTAGTYTATVTDANGCTATAAVVITQPPAMTVTPSAPVICAGGNVILTASGAVTYSWSPATGLSATVGATVTASPAVTTLYTVTGTAGACISTATVLVTVNPTPTITLIPPSSNLCSGDSLTITASGANSYTWAPAAGLSNTVGLIVTAFPAVTTTYTVTGTSNGCSGTATVTITVSPTPTVTVNPASPAPICSGGNVILTASGAGSYSWSPATGLSATVGSTVTASPSVTTSYTVTGTNGSCSSIATVVVKVNPTPTVTVTPASASICTGGPGTNLTASGAATYSWAPAGGLSATTGSSVTANPGATTTYTVTGTQGSCTATATVTITVNPTPTVTVLPSSVAMCSGKSMTLTASGAASYTWAPATGLSATVGSTVTASPSVTTSYTVTGSNGSCTGTAVVLVTISATPTVTVSPSSASICASGPGVNLNASGAAGYSWSPGAGLSATSGPVVTATPTITTTYTIVGTSPTGCQDSAKVTVTVDSAVVAKIAGKDTICAGDSTTLTASGGGTYKWNTGSTNASITVAPSSSMSYSVTVKVGGCTATASVNVVVNKAAVINIIQTGDTLKCTPTGLTYQWYKGSSPIVGSTFDSLHVNTVGTYKVYVTNSSGCSDTGVYVVTGFEGINEISLSENISIYPNPTTGNVQIECNIPEGDYTMSMTDVLGQVLFTERMHVKGVYTKTMSMYNYSSGIYILSIRGENTTTEKKIILNK